MLPRSHQILKLVKRQIEGPVVILDSGCDTQKNTPLVRKTLLNMVLRFRFECSSPQRLRWGNDFRRKALISKPWVSKTIALKGKHLVCRVKPLVKQVTPQPPKSAKININKCSFDSTTYIYLVYHILLIQQQILHCVLMFYNRCLVKAIKKMVVRLPGKCFWRIWRC